MRDRLEAEQEAPTVIGEYNRTVVPLEKVTTGSVRQPPTVAWLTPGAKAKSGPARSGGSAGVPAGSG